MYRAIDKCLAHFEEKKQNVEGGLRQQTIEGYI
jgi:hypothetical protein